MALYDPFDLPSTIQAGALGVERESALRGISFEIVESPVRPFPFPFNRGLLTDNMDG